MPRKERSLSTILTVFSPRAPFLLLVAKHPVVKPQKEFSRSRSSLEELPDYFLLRVERCIAVLWTQTTALLLELLRLLLQHAAANRIAEADARS